MNTQDEIKKISKEFDVLYKHFLSKREELTRRMAGVILKAGIRNNYKESATSNTELYDKKYKISIKEL